MERIANDKSVRGETEDDGLIRMLPDKSLNMSPNCKCARAANRLLNSAMSEDATITRIVLDAAIWREGYIAGRCGRELEANPYPACTLKARAWQVGHAEGRKKPLRLVD